MPMLMRVAIGHCPQEGVERLKQDQGDAAEQAF